MLQVPQVNEPPPSVHKGRFYVEPSSVQHRKRVYSRDTLDSSLGTALCTSEQSFVRVGALNDVVQSLIDKPNIQYDHHMLIAACTALLTDEWPSVRSAALRCLRHILLDWSHVIVLYNHLAHLLLARSFDTAPGNEQEREQAIRLIGHVLTMAGEGEEERLEHPICKIVWQCLYNHLRNECYAGRDRLWTSTVCLGLEHCLRHRLYSSLKWMPTILQSPQLSPLQSNAITQVLCNLLDRPQSRYECQSYSLLMSLAAPLIDADSDDLDVNHAAVLRTVLRSWTGVLCGSSDRITRRRPGLDQHSQQPNVKPSLFRVLLDSLSLNANATRTNEILMLIADLLFVDELYGDDMFNSWANVANYMRSSTHRLSYNKQCRYFLQPLDATAIDCRQVYRSILLYELISDGLTKALTCVILDGPDTREGLKATVLLSLLLRMATNCMPWIHRTLSIPFVVETIIDTRRLAATMEKDFTRMVHTPLTALSQNAWTLFARLDRLQSANVHDLGRVVTDNTLNQLLIRYKYSNRLDNNQEKEQQPTDNWFGESSAEPEAMPNMRSTSNNQERLYDTIRDSMVLIRYNSSPIVESSNYDWTSIYLTLTMLDGWRGDAPYLLEKRMGDEKVHKFLTQLSIFYLPQSRQFSSLLVDDPSSTILCQCFCALVRVTMAMADSFEYCQKAIKRLLDEVDNLLAPERYGAGMLAEPSIRRTVCYVYYIVIGEVGSMQSGRIALAETQIWQRLSALINRDTTPSLTHHIITSLHYAHNINARFIFERALIGGNLASRRVATKHIRTLARLCIDLVSADESSPTLSSASINQQSIAWIIELLSIQLNDVSQRIVAKAVEIIHELLTNEHYLREWHAYWPQTPTATSILGDEGVFISTYLLSSEEFVGRNMALVEETIAAWHTKHCRRYALALQNRVNSALMMVHRDTDGIFERHASTARRPMLRLNRIKLPPHAFAQLASHQTGRTMLCSSGYVTEAVHVLRGHRISLDSMDKDVDEINAAIWTVTSVCANDDALLEILPCDVIALIVKVMEECTVLSVRGTCLLAIQQMATSSHAVQQLNGLAWHCGQSNDFIQSSDATVHFKLYNSSDSSASDNETGPITESKVTAACTERFVSSQVTKQRSDTKERRSQSTGAATQKAKEPKDVLRKRNQSLIQYDTSTARREGEDEEDVSGRSRGGTVDSLGGYTKAKQRRRARNRALAAFGPVLIHAADTMRTQLGIKAKALVYTSSPGLLQDGRCASGVRGDVENYWKQNDAHTFLTSDEEWGLLQWRAMGKGKKDDHAEMHACWIGVRQVMEEYRRAWSDITVKSVEEEKDGFVYSLTTPSHHLANLVLPYDVKTISQNIAMGDNMTPTLQPQYSMDHLTSHSTHSCLQCNNYRHSNTTESGIFGDVEPNLNSTAHATLSPGRSRANTKASAYNVGNDDELRQQIVHLLNKPTMQQKGAQDALLNLKAHNVHSFKSLCLYSDILLYMYDVSINIAPSMAQFIHELFNEVNFTDLWHAPSGHYAMATSDIEEEDPSSIDDIDDILTSSVSQDDLMRKNSQEIPLLQSVRMLTGNHSNSTDSDDITII